MNGATTDPCDKTSNPPTVSIITIIGISQNFFRVQRNRANSPIKENIVSLDQRKLNGGCEQYPDATGSGCKAPAVAKFAKLLGSPVAPRIAQTRSPVALKTLAHSRLIAKQNREAPKEGAH